MCIALSFCLLVDVEGCYSSYIININYDKILLGFFFIILSDDNYLFPKFAK